jgi:hypothetical protein
MTRGPGEDKGRMRAASTRRPRPRKRCPDLCRVWFVPDTAAICFRDGSARWAAFLSDSTYPDARARFESPHRRPVGGHRRTRERKHGNKARTDRESQTKCRWGVEWSIFLLPVPCYFHQCGRSGSTSAPAHRESSTSAAFVAARARPTATEEDKEDAALDGRRGHAPMRGWPEATDRLELSRATEDRWSMRGSSR